MNATRNTHPWYCTDHRVESYRQYLHNGGNPTVTQSLKILRTIMLNAMVVGLAAFSMTQGGDPTWVPSGAFAVLALVNGFEYSDWAAFRQAMAEAQEEQE